MKIHVKTLKVAPVWGELLSNFFEQRQHEGIQFKDGDTIQMGWMWFRLKAFGDLLQAQSPRFGHMPFEWEDDCSAGVSAVMFQRYIADSFNAPMTACHCCQSALILKGADRKDGLFMNRLTTEESNNSGWFIGVGRSRLDPNDPKNLERKSLWEISCLFPETLEFWMLGANWQVVFEGSPIVLCDFKKIQPVVGSYYPKKYGPNT